jgi:predicted RNA binding protein YcfA (HicA-like mRNA interferase family)
MRAMSGRDFARFIERYGWQLLRVKGSHHVYGKAGTVVRLSIPIHANRTLKIGLQRRLMTMAQIPERD